MINKNEAIIRDILRKQNDDIVRIIYNVDMPDVPYDPYELVSDLNGNVMEVPQNELCDDMSYQFYPETKTIEVQLNDALDEYQKRFQVARALGHYFLYTRDSDDLDIRRSLENVDRDWLITDFAEKFLMPEFQVAELLDMHDPNMTVPSVKAFATHFQVSEDLAEKRLRDLKLIGFMESFQDHTLAEIIQETEESEIDAVYGDSFAKKVMQLENSKYVKKIYDYLELEMPGDLIGLVDFLKGTVKECPAREIKETGFEYDIQDGTFIVWVNTDLDATQKRYHIACGVGKAIIYRLSIMFGDEDDEWKNMPSMFQWASADFGEKLLMPDFRIKELLSCKDKDISVEQTARYFGVSVPLADKRIYEILEGQP